MNELECLNSIMIKRYTYLKLGISNYDLWKNFIVDIYDYYLYLKDLEDEKIRITGSGLEIDNEVYVSCEHGVFITNLNSNINSLDNLLDDDYYKDIVTLMEKYNYKFVLGLRFLII